jgi:ankyrin repeat protein
VCFNHELARKLPHRNLFGRKKQAAGQPLRSEDRERIFQLARQPDSFYSLIINLQTHQFNVNTERDDSGDLLIHIAVQGGLPSLPLLLTLLNHFGADVNGRDRNGMTPLSLACRLGHSRVAEVLVCVGGADVKLQDPTRRQTALHCASLYGHPDIIRMLLRRGANPSIEDSNKCDPAFLARKAGFHECRQILTHHIKNRFSILATQTENVSMYVSMSAEHALEVCFCMCGISMTLYVYSVHVHVYIRTPWM